MLEKEQNYGRCLLRRTLSLSRAVATEQVTDDTIATRHILRLTWKVLARSQALKVLDAVDMSWHVAGSRKGQDSLHAPLIFRRGATLVLRSRKT